MRRAGWWLSVALGMALFACDDETSAVAPIAADCGLVGDAGCGASALPDAEVDSGEAEDAAPLPDAEAPDAALADAELPDAEAPAQLTVVEAHEHDIGGNWLSAGQPSEARVRDLVALGARIISLRAPQEDPFDEAGLIAELGGTFTRYPVRASDYASAPFREALYDLYDDHLAEPGPVYLHCASANRAGASWALYQAERRGVAPEEALELGRAAGMRGTESVVREVLGLD